MKSELALKISSRYRKMWLWSIVSVILFIIATVGSIALLAMLGLKETSAANSTVLTTEHSFGYDSTILVALLLFILATFALIVTLVYAFMFLYSSWQTVELKSDSVGALGRVLLLLVPMFSIIWNFFYYCDFASRANKKASLLGIRERMSRVVAFAYCILPVVSFVISMFMPMNLSSVLQGNMSPEQVATAFGGILTVGGISSAISLLTLILLVIFVVQEKSVAVAIAEAASNKGGEVGENVR